MSERWLAWYDSLRYRYLFTVCLIEVTITMGIALGICFMIDRFVGQAIRYP